MKDRLGSVMARFLPDMFTLIRGHGQPGSDNMGITVIYIMPAIQFIQQIIFPCCQPLVQNVKVSKQRNLPQLDVSSTSMAVFGRAGRNSAAQLTYTVKKIRSKLHKFET